MNQIYLGQRTHGFSAAARTYFGKSLQELTPAEAAMLAGIPKNPVRHNPVTGPHAAKQRQLVVLKLMLDNKVIDEAQYKQALAEPMRINTRQQFDSHADYVAEIVRQQIVSEYKDEAYTSGIKVYTTITKAEQDAAYESVRRNVIDYDQRHGYRGPEAFIELPSDEEERDAAIEKVHGQTILRMTYCFLPS